MNAIERWMPKFWQDIIGNGELKEHLRNILRAASVGSNRGLNTLTWGASRAGKTATMRFFGQCLLCRELDPASLNPCGTCARCSTRGDVIYGARGLETENAQYWRHVAIVDCTVVNEGYIRELLAELGEYDGLRMIYLDEVHRLSRHFMDERLLKPLEDREYMWAASAITLKDLDTAFKNRFIKIPLEAPSTEELIRWTKERCSEFGIQFDSEDTLSCLAEKAGCIPGFVLQFLARANSRPDKAVTQELVDKHVFDFE
jgi:hypothetical protein